MIDATMVVSNCELSNDTPTAVMSGRPIDVVTFGETMGLLIPKQRLPVEYELSYAGAESNLAVAMARMGHRIRWLSRLGDDNVGTFITDQLDAEGVEVVAERDSLHPTGLMLKEIKGGLTRIHYYRANSAFAHLADSPGLENIAGARWLHLTGITLALSEKCREATFNLTAAARDLGIKVSVDVNVRASLWSDDDTARYSILELVRQADLVFVGRDEAIFLTGDTTASDFAHHAGVRPDCPVVLKLAEAGAEYSHDGQARVVQPAMETEVLDTTGAGDAFAAGFLSGVLRGSHVSASMQLGHLLASRVLGVAGDIGAPTAPEEVDRVLAAAEGPQ